MTTTYGDARLPDGVIGSKANLDSRKGLYFDPPLYMPASGIVFDYVDVIDKTELEAAANWDANLVPWATRHTKGLRIRTSGYTGSVTEGSTTFTIYNGLIVNVS